MARRYVLPSARTQIFHIYCTATKLRESNVFSSVCPSFCPQSLSEGSSCDHYPWCIGPHHTGNLRPSHGPSSVKGPSLEDPHPMLVTFGGQDQRPFQTCSHEDPFPMLTSGDWLLKQLWWASGRYDSYWKTFLLWVILKFGSTTGAQLIGFKISCIFLYFNSLTSTPDLH